MSPATDDVGIREWNFVDRNFIFVDLEVIRVLCFYGLWSAVINVSARFEWAVVREMNRKGVHPLQLIPEHLYVLAHIYVLLHGHAASRYVDLADTFYSPLPTTPSAPHKSTTINLYRY